MSNQERSYLDTSTRPIDLGNGSVAISTIDPDGSTSYWIFVRGVGGEAPTDPFPCARHEHLGQLPDQYRRALGLVCGATTRTGKRCTRLVSVQGAVCHQHILVECSSDLAENGGNHPDRWFPEPPGNHREPPGTQCAVCARSLAPGRAVDGHTRCADCTTERTAS